MKSTAEDLIGRKMGKLQVLSLDHRDHNSTPYFKCLCDCGTEKLIHGAHLKAGRIVSCGCVQRQTKKTHGGASRVTGHDDLYEVWRGMKSRCNDPKATGYSYYGGRGITVCTDWVNSFPNFKKDMGARPLGETLDRIDVNGNYEPSNCRWATWSVQMRNRRPKT